VSSQAGKMEFGIALPTYPAGATVDGVVEVSQAAEELGFSSAWTTDHVILLADEAGPYESIFEPLMSLAYVAGFARRIKLGISVIVVPQRNGIVLAKELATLDHLCQGRLIVGVGAGWNEAEFKMLGYGDRFRFRGAYLDETIAVWQHLWTTPEMPFQGKYYELPSVAFGPKPVQAGGPPIWVGGSSGGARRRAGRVGEAWHPVGIPAGDIEEMSKLVREAAAAESRQTPAIAPRLPMRLGTEQRESKTARKMQILIGEPEQMVKELRAYQKAGASEIICLFGDPRSADVIAQMSRFSAEVMPAFS
jgi:probable F420-dependent oxidoreductase